MRFSARGRMLIRYHIWFEKQTSHIPVATHADEIIIHGHLTPFHGDWLSCERQCSLVSSLCNEETMFQQIKKSFRYEINRAKKEKVHIETYNYNDILKHPEVMDIFARMYSAMYSEKGMHQRLNVEELLGYVHNHCFYLTVAELEDKPVVCHSYVCSDEATRLMHSCSEFRNIDNEGKNAIGRANKYLHWSDMLYFKELGVKEYDWGGCSSFENPNGIDMFKMAFGGEQVQYYNTTVIVSIRAKAKYITQKMIRRIILWTKKHYTT